MPTYILTHNPKNSDDQSKTWATELSRGKKPETGWSTGATKKICSGDRLFWLLLGNQPTKGIFASGQATSKCWEGEHWNDPDKVANYVSVQIDAVCVPEEEAVLAQDILRREIPLKNNWSPQASGYELPESAAGKLEDLWKKHRRQVIEKIAASIELVIPQEEPLSPRGQGFCSDPDQNRAVEIAAIEFVKTKYLSQGWHIDSVELDRCGYDLECSRRGKKLHIEVKGVSGTLPQFIITTNEVEQARNDRLWRLCVVTNARTSKPQCREWSGAEFTNEYQLTPLQYMARNVLLPPVIARRTKLEDIVDCSFTARGKRLIYEFDSEYGDETEIFCTQIWAGKSGELSVRFSEGDRLIWCRLLGVRLNDLTNEQINDEFGQWIPKCVHDGLADFAGSGDEGEDTEDEDEDEDESEDEDEDEGIELEKGMNVEFKKGKKTFTGKLVKIVDEEVTIKTDKGNVTTKVEDIISIVD